MNPREMQREQGYERDKSRGREDDNVRGKLEQRVTIRFICALSTMTDRGGRNHREGSAA